MEPKICLITPLLERVEDYGKTNFELMKLKTVEKTADISSSLTSRLILASVILIFAMALNITIGLWLGDLMGKSYYGFLILSIFYAVVALILYFVHPAMKSRLKNVIINRMLN